MIDKSNQIFTRVKNSVSSLCSSASQTYMDTPPQFPHLYLQQADNSSSNDDLDNNENAVNTMIEITVYTTGTSKLTDGKKIHNLSDTEMRSMGFRRIFGPQQITNISDTSVCRLIARYTRIIGSNDTL